MLNLTIECTTENDESFPTIMIFNKRKRKKKGKQRFSIARMLLVTQLSRQLRLGIALYQSQWVTRTWMAQRAYTTPRHFVFLE